MTDSCNGVVEATAGNGNRWLKVVVGVLQKSSHLYKCLSVCASMDEGISENALEKRSSFSLAFLFRFDDIIIWTAPNAE